MAITFHPTVGFENLLRKEGATLSSTDATDTAYPLSNLASGNLGVVALLTSTTVNRFVLDQGATNVIAAGAVYLRFREGWEDISSVVVEAHTSSSWGAPSYTATYTNLFPATGNWDIGVPRRPIFRCVFAAQTYQFWRITVNRTTGTADLSLGTCYIGPVVQLNNLEDGIAAYGHAVDTETATESLTADIDTDFRFARPPRRSAAIKLEASNEAKARSQWFAKLMFAARNADIFYSYNPLETDPVLIHAETLWGPGVLSGFTYQDYDSWEGTLTIQERL